MRLYDFTGLHRVSTLSELEDALKKRYGDEANYFELSDDEALYPTIMIFVRGGLSALYYIPEESLAGYSSWGKGNSLVLPIHN